MPHGLDLSVNLAHRHRVLAKMAPVDHYTRRRAHTFIELVAALVASAMLLAGLGSVMFIARQIAYVPSSSAHRLEASGLIRDLADDLRLATFITERSQRVLEFVVADRNDDGTEEHIRYEWSGTPGDPILRTYNDGQPVAVLDSVQDFDLQYTVEQAMESIETTTDTAEVMLLGNTSLQSSNTRDITDTQWSAQRIDPSAFSTAPPADALYWNATRTDVHCKQDGSQSGTLFVQLRSTGEPYSSPTSHVLGQVSIPEANLSSNLAWNAATFPAPVRRLALHRKYEIVWSGTGGGKTAKQTTDNVSPSGAFETLNAGASWSFLPTMQLYYRLYGTYTSPGPTYDVTRNYLANVSVRLQTSVEAHSRVDARVTLDNLPELLSAYWRTDFDTDPTTSDVNGDGTADWQTATPTGVTGAVPFVPASVDGGTWYVKGQLQTQPSNDFSTPTSVEVRFRDTTPGGSGAVAWINADWDNNSYAPLFVTVQLQLDGTQSLWVTGKSDDDTEEVLCQMDKLPTDLVRCRLTILPEHDVVNVRINGEDVGTFAYPTYLASSTDHFLAAFGDTAAAEFDYVEVRVSESE